MKDESFAAGSNMLSRPIDWRQPLRGTRILSGYLKKPM